MPVVLSPGTCASTPFPPLRASFRHLACTVLPQAPVLCPICFKNTPGVILAATANGWPAVNVHAVCAGALLVGAPTQVDLVRTSPPSAPPHPLCVLVRLHLRRCLMVLPLLHHLRLVAVSSLDNELHDGGSGTEALRAATATGMFSRRGVPVLPGHHRRTGAVHVPRLQPLLPPRLWP